MAWYFTDDGKVLLITFLHESELNVYEAYGAAKDYADQRSYFRGVPEDLVALVENQEESHLLNIEDASGEKTIHTATGVYWCDGTSWHVAEGLLEHGRNIGVDEFNEAGIYILYRYILGRPFTPEAYHAATLNEFLSEEANQKRLEHLRMVFTSIP